MNAPGENPKKILLKDKAYIEIKECILNEVFKPGDFLSESQLIKLLGMSKTPIKYALERLEYEGYVTVSPKQGIIVRELDITKIIDIYDLRIALEMFVMDHIVGKLKESQIKEIEENFEKSEAFATAGDERNFAKADADFHLLLCKFSGNNEIYQVMRNYHDYLYRVTLRVLKKDTNRMATSIEDHREIFYSLKEGNIDKSSTLMKKHLLYGKRILTL